MDQFPNPLPNETGEPYIINVPGPAAGADFTQLMPNNYIYRLVYVHYKIVTDVTVVNRYPGFALSQSGIFTLNIIPPVSIPASRTVHVNHCVGNNQPATLVSDYYCNPAPYPLYINPSDTIRSQVVQIAAGDQLSDIYLRFERWPYQSV
jgi:hypothetical protein